MGKPVDRNSIKNNELTLPAITCLASVTIKDTLANCLLTEFDNPTQSKVPSFRKAVACFQVLCVPFGLTIFYCAKT
jgi:hypothetical protein